MELDSFMNKELKSVKDGKVKKCLKELMNAFIKQGHSGMSANLVSRLFADKYKDNPESIDKSLFSKKEDFYAGITGITIKELSEILKNWNLNEEDKLNVLEKFKLLSDFKPLTPLTFKDEEWNDVSDISQEPAFQNKRDPSVFKDEKDGKPYTIDAFYMKNQENMTYTGSLDTPNGKIKHCYIKDQNNMPQICIDTIDWEVNKDDESIKEPGSGWWVTIMKDSSQISELEKFYDVEYWKEDNNETL